MRECRVYSQLVPHDIPVDEIKARRPKGLIFSGGPMSVYVDGAPAADPRLFELGIPILGICYGAQLMAQLLGGTVAKTGVREFGKTQLRVTANGLLLDGLADEEQCWMSHGDGIAAAPDGFTTLATTDRAPVAAMEDRERGFYAVQFHPEVVHTPRGMDVLKNFLYEACDCTPIVDAGLDHRGAGASASASRSGRPTRRSSASPAASTRRSPPSSSTRPSATASPASSSTRACCAGTRPSTWSRCSRSTSASR